MPRALRQSGSMGSVTVRSLTHPSRISGVLVFQDGSLQDVRLGSTAQIAGKKLLPAEWRVLAFFLVAFCACYASVLVTPYAFMDDYALLVENIRGETEARTQWLIALGRPTYAVLVDLFFHYIHDISDLRYLRLAGVGGITLLAWFVYRLLVHVGWNRHQSVLLSAIVCTLPSFQVYAAWATTAFYVLAAIASGGAFHMAAQAFDQQRPLSKWSQTVAAVLIMTLALTIHQSADMFFWVFAVISLFRPDG